MKKREFKVLLKLLIYDCKNMSDLQQIQKIANTSQTMKKKQKEIWQRHTMEKYNEFRKKLRRGTIFI